MPGTASLIEEIDKKQQVVLRDGRIFIGYLRSVDQFANLVLQQTVERIHVGKLYGEEQIGSFVIRGENVVLMGEIDMENEEPKSLTKVSISKIKEERNRVQKDKEEQEKIKANAMKQRGLVSSYGKSYDNDGLF